MLTCTEATYPVLPDALSAEPSRAEPSPQVIGWLTQTRQARHPGTAAAGLAEAAGGVLGLPSLPPPGALSSPGHRLLTPTSVTREDRPAAGEETVPLLVPRCRDAERTQGLRAGRGVWPDPYWKLPALHSKPQTANYLSPGKQRCSQRQGDRC